MHMSYGWIPFQISLRITGIPLIGNPFIKCFLKLLSLILLFLLFYFGKKFLHYLFKKTILSSVKSFVKAKIDKDDREALRKYARLFLYFILIY